MATDSERLDWMQNCKRFQRSTVPGSGNTDTLWVVWDRDDRPHAGSTLREAIDKAITAELGMN